MANVNLKSLITRLSPLTRGALEAATGLCLSRTNYNVEVEHWLIKVIETTGSDLERALGALDIDPSRLGADLVQTLDRLKTGNARTPALSPDIVDLAQEAWLCASLEFDSSHVCSGHLLLTLLTNDRLARAAREASSEFASISPDALRVELAKIAEDSTEAGQAPRPSEKGASPKARKGGATPNLDQYTIDLTQHARDGHIDPVLGRDDEIRQVIDILTRRRQNNPILTGEPGVGKTAVAEGFALRVVAGEVPPPLKNVIVRTLDLSLLQAGAGVKGEFENRLKGVIEEVKGSVTPIILFIDEAHTMIGAGGPAGQGDAANLLKPALARGELRTIAATTWAEYKKYFEKDAALARRFQVVKIDEPSEAVAIEIMRGLAKVMEAHHHVRVEDDALVESVRLSSRYLAGRQLPDKSVSLLDTACARVSLSQSATPAAVDDARRSITRLQTEGRALGREHVIDGRHEDRIAEIEAEIASEEARLVALEERWKRECDLVEIVKSATARLEVHASGEEKLDEASLESTRAELATADEELSGLQVEEALVHPAVNGQAIAEVLASWTGIPMGRMVADEIKTVLQLKERLEERVIGQSHALDAIAQAIRTSRANLTDPNRPVGVFMLAGTSGVGKTETAIALAEELFGGEQNMTVINMSEFKEEHKVSLLMGSPPGYVGYGEGGVLTEAVRRKPYSVVLLDEVEKAHQGVQEVFYQVFDKGQLKDGEGRDIDFRNTVIILTTNAGTEAVMALCGDPETRPEPEAFVEAMHPELLKTFKPAFLGRCQVLPYYPLDEDVMRGIIELKLGKVTRRVREHYGAPLEYSPEVVSAILERCREVETGARNVDHILNRTLLPELASRFLAQMADGQDVGTVEIGVGEAGEFTYTLQPG
ncbi:MAG: type VI secretion system protein VasG [Planctomycetota bacterium]|jgi:type VI secretion system protein VasG